MHFRILKMIATSGFRRACTKFVFDPCPSPPLEELIALPRPHSWFKKMGGKRRKGEGEGREREKNG